MLIMVLLKEESIKKLVFLQGLKPWVQKIVYQSMNIPNICQGLMKMGECMEEEGPLRPKGEIGSGITQKQHVDQIVKAMTKISTSGANVSQGLTMTMGSCWLRSQQ